MIRRLPQLLSFSWLSAALFLTAIANSSSSAAEIADDFTLFYHTNRSETFDLYDFQGQVILLELIFRGPGGLE